MKIFRFPTLNKELIELRKLLLILAAILILPIQTAFASSLPICDFTPQELLDRCNQILLENEFPTITFDSIQQGNKYQTYTHTLGSSKTLFIVNSQNEIYQVTVTFQTDSEDSSNEGYASVESVLRSIGLTSEDFDTLPEDENQTNIWISDLNRRIMLEYSTDDSGLAYISITAEDR